MKLKSTINHWLYYFHRIINFSGYIALVAIMAGADVKTKPTNFIPDVPNFSPRKYSPSSFRDQQCSAKKTFSELNHSLDSKKTCDRVESAGKLN